MRHLFIMLYFIVIGERDTISTEMSEYQVSDIDPRVLATVNDELNKRERKEEQQRRHYQFLHELQTLARELPRYKLQGRSSNTIAYWNGHSALGTWLV